MAALQSLEAESNEGAETNDKTLETILWYEKFLGFRIVVGKGKPYTSLMLRLVTWCWCGAATVFPDKHLVSFFPSQDVKFVFNKIPQRREKEYSFRVSRSLQCELKLLLVSGQVPLLYISLLSFFFTFSTCIFSQKYSSFIAVIECDPHVKDIEELAKDLDLNEHLFKFARMAREKFQSSFMNGNQQFISFTFLR